MKDPDSFFDEDPLAPSKKPQGGTTKPPPVGEHRGILGTIIEYFSPSTPEPRLKRAKKKKNELPEHLAVTKGGSIEVNIKKLVESEAGQKALKGIEKIRKLTEEQNKSALETCIECERIFQKPFVDVEQKVCPTCVMQIIMGKQQPRNIKISEQTKKRFNIKPPPR